jgi:hypothetical protein
MQISVSLFLSFPFGHVPDYIGEDIQENIKVKEGQVP